MTPSLPTFFIASAMMLPMVESLLALIVPTWPIISPETGLENLSSSPFPRSPVLGSTGPQTTETAFSMPRFRAIGLAPAATVFTPSRKIAWARTVAVVVPSPATSEVLEATSFTIWAPMFSNLLSSSISLATVTPSLVIVGDPKVFSMMTLRPLGPSVTFTASASVLTPLRMVSRARTSNRISLAAISLVSDCAGKRDLLLDDAEDVFLAHHQVLFAFDLDVGPGVLREEHAIADLDVERTDLAILEDLAVADRDDLALDRLFLGGVRDDDAALGLLFLLHALDDHAILQRPNLHWVSPCYDSGKRLGTP